MQITVPLQAMNYHSFLLGFFGIALALGLTFLIIDFILQRRGSLLFPMVMLYICVLVGIIYTTLWLCLIAPWAYPLRVLGGVVLGVAVGWGLLMVLQIASWIVLLVTWPFRKDQ